MSQVGPNHLDEMTTYLQKADRELSASLSLTTKPYLSALYLIDVYGLVGQRDLLKASLMRANAALPSKCPRTSRVCELLVAAMGWVIQRVGRVHRKYQARGDTEQRNDATRGAKVQRHGKRARRARRTCRSQREIRASLAARGKGWRPIQHRKPSSLAQVHVIWRAGFQVVLSLVKAKARGLTLPSSGHAFGMPLKSNVGRHEQRNDALSY